MKEFYIGLMSGTSVDSIDSVLVNLSKNSCEIINKASTPINQKLKKRVFEAVNRKDLIQSEIHELDLQMGELFGQSVLSLLRKVSIKTNKVKAIGSHGQTIKHLPYGNDRYSLQIGSPKIITDLTKIKTVADFRKSDIEAGGQGAPLSPLFHEYLFKINKVSKGVIINIGGISNLTRLDLSEKRISAYDSGPGNCLLDSWCRKHKKKDFDFEGSWAASGKVNPDLLKKMMEDYFFTKNPPKSTGPDYFNPRWIKNHIKNFKDLSPEDIQATLNELTVKTIFSELKKTKSLKEKIYICGGGIHNTFLINRLEEMIGNKTLSTTDLGINPDYLEACCFAWLAKERLKEKKFNLSSITGSSKPILLGEIWEPF